MKRYVISKIVQENIPGMGAVNRHRMQQLTDSSHADYIPGLEFLPGVGEIPVGQDGQPTEKGILCLVRGVKHKLLKADPHVVSMPQVWLDDKIGNIHTATKLKCKAELKALGINEAEVENVFTNADGFRDVIRHFGRKGNPDFDENDFDLSED